MYMFHLLAFLFTFFVYLFVVVVFSVAPITITDLILFIAICKECLYSK